MWDDNENELLPYTVVYPQELDENDRFSFDVAYFFNIGTSNPNRNNLEYVTINLVSFEASIIFSIYSLVNSSDIPS